ncbi:DUF1654 domain-containing protein [Azotobacter chroococcum]|uniref:Uncharacterized protein DUF1654 n=1 Tax=Azotobacter chroococcum TaxID=353 RepID=A0A4R1PWE0_9GAMM|nr:DUF1654 domain-containing protein [Azotobacter chroococcum]TBV91343.1 DUF1654 domain-containing protein [Azotobacter chroococcum]TCL32500.1 uncharacterized protein DUF1654 [Azotobacter chroococcum]
MAKPNAYASVTPTSYELLARRIHRQVMSPSAQLQRRTVIAREPGEREDDWDLLLEQLSEEESVRMTRLEGGAVQLTWTNQHPD